MKFSTVALVSAVTTVSAQAADVVITPPAGGGFSVGTQAGGPVFRVDSATGGVYLQYLPSGLGNTPMCWNAATGLLSACQAASSSTDTTPPIISTDAPAVATQGQQSFTITCTDNNELLYCGTPTSSSMSPDTKSFTTAPRSQYVSLSNGGFSEVVVATDMAGNSTKLKIDIQTPQVGISLKRYKTITPSVVPVGFDCRPTSFRSNQIDGAPIDSVVPNEKYGYGIWPGAYKGWTENGGYILGTSISGQTTISNGNILSSINIELSSDGKTDQGFEPGPIRTPLSATTVTMPRTISGSTYGGGGGSSGYLYLQTAHRGSVEYSAASDELRVSVTMECGTGTSSSGPFTWTDGTIFTFTARP